MATHVYTSVAANYLPKARVLAQSVKKHHPDFKFHVVLCDALPDWFAIEREPFDSVITLDDFALPHPEQWIFKHTLVELSTAVKGFALEKLLALPDCAEVLYFDPDIVVLSSLKRLLDEFAHASILLTPHITQPEDTIEAILDNEFSVLQHGIYNLGFAGVKNSPEGRRFARWWAERLNLFCYDDIPRGIFTDQRWADLVPAYFNDHKILRDPIYNVCTWNLTHRAVTGSLEHGLLVNGQPITFYHFSGFDSGAQQGMLDKYGSGMPALYELREWYIAECERMGQSELAGIPWAYGFFDNGERILNTHRRRYRDRPDLQSAFANPYTTADLSRSYLHWFNRNEEISSPVQKRAETADFPATPDYRVFLIAAAGDAPFLSETLRLVHQRSHCADRISLVAPAAILAETPAPPGTAAVPLELHRYDEMFAEILRRFGDKDALLIRAGAIPPEKWDLRLAWSAVRQPGIATVSPIDERLLDPSGHLRSGVEQNILDRLCYWHRQPTDPEISSFSRECVYVRACALRDVSSLGKQFRPADVLEGSARLRFTHVLATHICVGWRRPRVTDFAILPDATFSAALTRLRDRIRAHADALNSSPPAVVKSMTGPNLHIMHSWGGGLERWVADYCRADRAHDNFVLKSVGPLGSFGAALHLYRDIEDPEPLRVWPIEPAIKASATRHSAYESALSEIVQEYGIRRILVSSLIGHSVDALRQPLDTIFIAHDYYPFCSALNITFDEVCPSCEQPRLAACVQENPHNRFFRNVPPSEWLAIRKEFAGAIKNNAVTLVAPSPSVQRNYARLCPDLPAFHIIPHGTPPLESLPLELDFDPGGPLRVVVLGSLAPQKGGLLLECILPEIVQFCDVTLLGCGAYGTPYTENPSITVIPQYAHKDLAKRIAERNPHVGLLLSVVPETFSYTLRELQELRLPVLATNIGSFADRIEDSVTGLLCEADAAAVINRLKALHQDRAALRHIHQNLKTPAHHSLEDMLKQYEALHATRYSPSRYFGTSHAPQALPERSLQLFWRTASGSFAETDSTTVAPLGRDRQIARLYFVTGSEPIAQLRLDLSSQRGFFFLHDLLLRDFQDRVFWNWDHTVISLEASIHNDIVFFKTQERDAPALLYFSGNDPFVVLPIDAELLARITRAACIEVHFSLASAEASVDVLLSSVNDANERQVQAELRAQSAEASVEVLLSSVNDANERQAQAELRAQSEERRAAQIDMQLRALQSQMDTQLRALQSQMDTQVHALQRQMVAVQNSLSWRVTRPARALAAGARKVKRFMLLSLGRVRL